MDHHYRDDERDREKEIRTRNDIKLAPLLLLWLVAHVQNIYPD